MHALLLRVVSQIHCQKLDNVYVDLILDNVFDAAIDKLKPGKAVDNGGVCNEALSYLGTSCFKPK